MIDLPYSKLNLRFNPFGELDRGQRIKSAHPRCDLGSVVDWMQDDKSATQFMGRPGSGKSTHLLLLTSLVPGFKYVHLPPETKRSVPPARDLMVDEAQRLNRLQRRSLFANATRIILGTHRNLEGPLRKNGFRVVTIDLDQQPEESWLQETLNRKIQMAQRCNHGKRTIPSIDRDTVLKLIDEFGNNIRAMERNLYDTFLALNGNDEQV